MPEINLLSQNTIDQIAAGEVVERPASVVKELVENAIDATATAITVEIKEGGISLIRVTDNGFGVEKEQVKKAFLRHATSKISSIEDLNHIQSLGFRGEALSSIAAVAQVEIITKTQASLTGLRYAIAGGKEETVEEIGAPSGTTFLIRNLFFNTPARKKFLKQPATEGSYIADLMEHIALSRPDISIKFVNNGQVRFHTSGNGNLKEVIYRIFGKEISSALIPLEVSGHGFTVNGYLGKPEINRSNRNFEIYFVNGRYIRNDIISKALEEGYRHFLMQHKFPFVVLQFTMNPQSIDVNVHPSKMEIRVHNGPELFTFLSDTVYNQLHKIELIPNVMLTLEKEDNTSVKTQKVPEPFEAVRIQKEAISAKEAPLQLREAAAPYITVAAEQAFAQKLFTSKIPVNKILGRTPEERSGANEEIHSNIIKANEHILVEKAGQLDFFEEKLLTREASAAYQLLGQIFDTYWLIAFKEKLFIIDQHAAHEKVKYERLLKELVNKDIHSQILNPPVILSLSAKEEALMQENLSAFDKMGFELEEFGGNSYTLRSIPVDLYGCNEKELFLHILDELSENPLTGAPEAILNKLASMACKAAVKGNNKLTLEEAGKLIDELLTLDNPYHCPHGRPTIIAMSKYEIEKKFKRIV